MIFSVLLKDDWWPDCCLPSDRDADACSFEWYFGPPAAGEGDFEADESLGRTVPGDVVVVVGDGFLGYCRAAAPAADRTGLEADEPISGGSSGTIIREKSVAILCDHNAASIDI